MFDFLKLKKRKKNLHYLICHTCKVRHPVWDEVQLIKDFVEFCDRHLGHDREIFPSINRHSSLGQILSYLPNASVKIAYGTSTAITITLNSLANSATAGRESTAVDNTSNLYLGADVTVILKIATGTPANDKASYVWAYYSEDGTNFTSNATGADAAITLQDPTCLKLIQVIPMPTASLSYPAVFPVDIGMGGHLTRKWGIVVRDYCGINLDSTGNSASYSGIYETVV